MDAPTTGPRRAATWLALGIVPAVIQVVVYLVTGTRPREFIVDVAELTDDVAMFTSVFSRMGILLWFASASVLLVTASTLEPDDDILPALRWVGGLSLYLGFDDGLVLHENLPQPFGLTDAFWVLPAAGVAGWILLTHGHRLRPERDLGFLALGAFGVSLAIDAVVEGVLQSYATGVLFAEENAKFLGIIAWFGMSASASRRAILRARVPDGAVSP